MEVAQFVALLGEGGEEGEFVEAVTDSSASFIGGDGEVIEDLVRPPSASLRICCTVGFGLGGGPLVGPGCHAGDDFEGLLVAGEDVHVEQAGHYLVEGVKGAQTLLRCWRR